MFRKICYLMAAFLLIAILGYNFGPETGGDNISGQGNITETKKVKDAGEEANEAALNWYREYFVIWKASQGELVAKLGENSKRDRAYIQRTIAALENLSEVLPGKKKQDLENYLARYRQIAGSLERGLRKTRERKRMKRTLNNLKGEIEKKFSYKIVEVKADLIKRDREIIESGKVPRLAGVPPSRGTRYRYVAGRNARIFHKVMCSYVSKINKDDRVYFETKKEAEKSGRRLHRHCR